MALLSPGGGRSEVNKGNAVSTTLANNDDSDNDNRNTHSKS